MTTHRAFAAALASSHAPVTPRSRARRGPIAPRAPLALLALLALPATATTTVVMVLAASLIGPFILFAIPLMLVFGFALGPLHALLRGEL